VGGGLSLFTELPKRDILGSPDSGMSSSRKPGFFRESGEMSLSLRREAIFSTNPQLAA